MSFFEDEDLNNMFNDWSKRMREHRKKNKNNESEGDEVPVNNLFGALMDFSTTNEDFSKLEELGEPDRIEEFEENGVKFTKKIWETKEGEYVLLESVGSISGSDIEEVLKNTNMGPFNISEVPLEEALENALEEENYEEAARIRDEIKDKKLFNK